MSSDNDDDDAVGYGRPPKKSRFKPGQSGNLRGRPKRRPFISFERMISDSLAETVTITENGRSKKISKGRAAAKQLANRAAKGELGALKMIASFMQALPLESPDHYVRPEDVREKVREIIERVMNAESVDDK